MAANFWDSTHSKLLLKPEDLYNCHLKDKSKGLTHQQLQRLHVYFVRYIQELSKGTLPLLRQRVAATAAYYFQRFYIKHNFCDWDPRLIAPACVYCASKTEESPLQAKFLCQYVKRYSAKYLHPSSGYDLKSLLDLELVVLEELDYKLIVFNPYHPMVQLLNDANRSDLVQDAWSVVNDSYCTAVSLLHPPHIIALGCIVTAAHVGGVDIGAWLSGLDVDLSQVSDVCMQLMELYEHYQLTISPDTCQRYMDILHCATEHNNQ